MCRSGSVISKARKYGVDPGPSNKIGELQLVANPASGSLRYCDGRIQYADPTSFSEKKQSSTLTPIMCKG